MVRGWRVECLREFFSLGLLIQQVMDRMLVMPVLDRVLVLPVLVLPAWRAGLCRVDD